MKNTKQVLIISPLKNFQEEGKNLHSSINPKKSPSSTAADFLKVEVCENGVADIVLEALAFLKGLKQSQLELCLKAWNKAFL